MQKKTTKKNSNGPKSALKSKRNSKIEGKEDAKRKKAIVKFNEEVEMHHFGERRWNDYKTKGATFTKGNFTAEEIKTLMNALCAYVKERNETEPMETLTTLCSRSK